MYNKLNSIDCLEKYRHFVMFFASTFVLFTVASFIYEIWSNDIA